ncbi:MAG: amidohydrolase family protein [candidate division WS1 bacterium]|jgi:predicted TIM-barrel fold metal-dependent hydrolase|nr:amidohydrolase family protein [candidate division WS1 bacterium]
MLIDCHTHASRSRAVPRASGSDYPLVEELIAKLDFYEIDRAVLLSGVAPEARSRFVPPEDVIEMYERYPDRLIPFCSLDPRAGRNSVEEDFRRFLQIYREMGCRGVGETTCNLPMDDPLVWNMFSACADEGMPVTIHIGPRIGGCYGLYDELGLPRLEKTLREFPDLIVFGHSQPFWAEIDADVTQETRGGSVKGSVRPGRLVDLFERYENLWGDLSAGSGHNALTRDPAFALEFIESFRDRLMFGTDLAYPEHEPPNPAHFRSLRGEVSDEAWENLAWRNIDRVLGLGIEALQKP